MADFKKTFFLKKFNKKKSTSKLYLIDDNMGPSTKANPFSRLQKPSKSVKNPCREVNGRGNKAWCEKRWMCLVGCPADISLYLQKANTLRDGVL